MTDLPDAIESLKALIQKLLEENAQLQGAYPPHATAAVQYGPGVRAWVTHLSVEHKMPLEHISHLFEDLYGYDLNTASVEDALERAYELTEAVEAQVIAQLQAADCVHFDETGLRVC